MKNRTWEERDVEIHQLFVARIKALMDSAHVSQTELAARMGGGVSQGNVSRWFAASGTKLTPGRFGTAVRALGGNPAKEFAAVVQTAREMGLFEPGTAVSRQERARRASRDEIASPFATVIDVPDFLLAANDPRANETGDDGADLGTEATDSP